MLSTLHYSKAPILEAIIDLRVVPLDGFDVGQFATLKAALGEDTQVEHLDFEQWHFQIGAGHNADEANIEHAASPAGFIFTSADERRILQARLDGFSFIQRAPYERWESFRDKARRLWNEYRSLYPFETVSRVALRYINRVDMPLDESREIDLSDYLKVLPTDPFDSSINVRRGFFMQLQVQQSDLKCELILNQAMAPPPDENTCSVLLDFDLFQERSEQPWRADEDDHVWDFLEKLRVRKNDLFEASVTPAFKERIR